MKRRFPILLIAAVILCAGWSMALADPVTITYTGDNIVGAWFQDGAAPVAYAPGTHANDWRVADTANLDLAPGHTYQIIFRVRNLLDVPTSDSNPAAFLAEISGPTVIGDLLTSVDWDWILATGDNLTDFSGLIWNPASVYPNGENGGDNIWTRNVSPNGPIAGISTAAQWIWADTATDGTSPTDIYLRATITVVPEPASLLLLGFGLFGVRLVVRRRV